MQKRPLAVLMGITGDLAFAAGCVVLALRRHNPGLDPDLFLYTDGTVPARDQEILRAMGVRLLPVPVFLPRLDADFTSRYSELALVRFEGLRFLRHYDAVLYLDVDTAIQGDLRPILSLSPLAVAHEDPSMSGTPPLAGVNLSAPVPGYDPAAPNVNSGVIVWGGGLPDPEALYRLCQDWLKEYRHSLFYVDQAILNMLCQHLSHRRKDIVTCLQHSRYNTHPCNAKAHESALVHAFGPHKFWNDALLRFLFPEWARDYARWTALGGSPFSGDVRNGQFLKEAPYALMCLLLQKYSGC